MSSFPYPNWLRPVCSHPFPSPHFFPKEGSHSRCLCASWVENGEHAFPAASLSPCHGSSSTEPGKPARSLWLFTPKERSKRFCNPSLFSQLFPNLTFFKPQCLLWAPSTPHVDQSQLRTSWVWLGLAPARVTAEAGVPWSASSWWGAAWVFRNTDASWKTVYKHRQNALLPELVGMHMTR